MSLGHFPIFDPVLEKGLRGIKGAKGDKGEAGIDVSSQPIKF